MWGSEVNSVQDIFLIKKKNVCIGYNNGNNNNNNNNIIVVVVCSVEQEY